MSELETLRAELDEEKRANGHLKIHYELRCKAEAALAAAQERIKALEAELVWRRGRAKSLQTELNHEMGKADLLREELSELQAQYEVTSHRLEDTSIRAQVAEKRVEELERGIQIGIDEIQNGFHMEHAVPGNTWFHTAQRSLQDALSTPQGTKEGEGNERR